MPRYRVPSTSGTGRLQCYPNRPMPLFMRRSPLVEARPDQPAHLFNAPFPPLFTCSPLLAPPDKVAYLFSQEFYKALFGTQRHTVQVAFDIASSAVCNMLNAGNPEQPGGPFVLLPSGEIIFENAFCTAVKRVNLRC